MSQDTDQKSAFGPGFIGACIIIAAVAICGAVLMFGRSGGSNAAASTAPGPQQSAAATPSATETEPAGPATPAATTGAGRSQGASGCNPSAGDQAVPGHAPAVDNWEVVSRIVVPRSAAYGPTTTDSDGFRRCFAHSPTGAVYAAYSAYAAMADQDKSVAIARKLMLPGPDTDALVHELEADRSSSGMTVPQLAGYRVIAADQDRVSLMLAAPVQSDFMSLNLTLVWHDGDWRLQPPPAGEAVGAPFAQHRDLSDFVAWSGV